MLVACTNAPGATIAAFGRGLGGLSVDKPARALAELRRVGLLSDAESSEYFAEQIIGGKLAGDRSERGLRQPQFFGEEFELRQLIVGGINVLSGRRQCAQMPFAGDEHVFGRMPAGDLQQRLAQQFNAFTGLGRERDCRSCIVVMTLGRISGEINLVVDGDSSQALRQLGENPLFGVADAVTRIDQ